MIQITDIEDPAVQALRELVENCPDSLQSLIVGTDTVLEERLTYRSTWFNMAIIEPNEHTRVGLRNLLYQFGQRAFLGENFHVFTYPSVDTFRRVAERKKGTIQSVLTRDTFTGMPLTDIVSAMNRRMCEDRGYYPGFNIFTYGDLERAYQQSYIDRYKELAPLETIIVTSESREVFAQRGVQLLNIIEDPKQIRMFKPSYRLKPQVEEILKHNSGLPAQLFIFDLSEGELDDKSNLPLLGKLISMNPHSFVIATVTGEQYHSLISGQHKKEFRQLQRHLPGGVSELTKLFRLDFDPALDYDRSKIKDFFAALRNDYQEHVLRYWNYLTGPVRVFGLPMPITVGVNIQKNQIEDLGQLVQLVESNVPLGAYSTMGLGGIGKCVVHPQTLEEYRAAVGFCGKNKLQHSIMGYGSNTIPGNLEALITTRKLNNLLELRIGGKEHDLTGIEGKSLRKELAKYLKGVKDGEDVLLTVQAGVHLQYIAALGQSLGLTRAEFLIRIPGQAGGGIYMNCAVGNSSMSKILEEVTVINPDGGIEVIEGEALKKGWGYRLSQFQNTNRPIYSATLRLKKADIQKITEKTKLYMDNRMGEPDDPSVGSMFLRRGYSGRQEGQIYHIEEILGGELPGMISKQKNLLVPAQIKSSSWITTNRNGPEVKTLLTTRKTSGATMYELAELIWTIGQEGLKQGVTLYFEAKFLGRDNNGNPLHSTMQNILAGITRPDDLQKGALEMGGIYLPK